MNNESNEGIGEAGAESPKAVAPQAINVQPPSSDFRLRDATARQAGETGGPKSGVGECGGVPPAETRVETSQPDVPTSKTITPMRKMREDSRWNQLTPEQREKLEIWMFDENLGYAKTLERAQAEFGIKASMSSVGRFYRWRVRERHAQELGEAQFTANVVNHSPVNTNNLRTATMKLVGTAALKLASEKPEEIEQLVSLTELLLEAEQNDLRRGRLEFAQRCFDYEATLATVKEIPQIRAYMQAIEDDDSLNSYQKTKKIQDMLFHWVREVKAGNVK